MRAIVNGTIYTSLDTISDGVILVDGVARWENGTIAESILTLKRAVINAREFGSLSLNDALKMATTNPARILGQSNMDKPGVGADADIVVRDDEGNVSLAMAAGGIVIRV